TLATSGCALSSAATLSIRFRAAGLRTSPLETSAITPGSIWRPVAAWKRFVAWTLCVAGSSTPYGLRRLDTPAPNTAAIAAPITATNSMRRRLACTNVASFSNMAMPSLCVVVGDARACSSCRHDRFHQAGDHVIDMAGHGHALGDRASRAEALNVPAYGRCRVENRVLAQGRLLAADALGVAATERGVGERSASALRVVDHSDLEQRAVR